jgi:hypothetical protein
MMTISLLDNSLKVEIFFEETDCEFEDNICIQFTETCPDEEKVFIHDETNLYMTASEAEQLAQILAEAVAASRAARQERCG